MQDEVETVAKAIEHTFGDLCIPVDARSTTRYEGIS